MRRSFQFLLTLILAVGVLGSFSYAKDFKYVGAAKCKTCHNTKKSGKQYTIWKNGPHAKAMESLKSEASLKYAKEHGIADPSTDPKCTKCHATMAAVDKALIDPKGKLTMEEGVSCESCHGPGSVYKKLSIMKDREKALANGLVLPEEKVCVTCHNEQNPFHKPFNYKEFSAKIAHPTPKKK
ncbi:YVTN beta-propeller repeat-containing protein [Caldithrix abyssi DSM 13497]|uniref:Cytochrome c554 and c-prime n=1 Tax=Caldithrix abyssi DSM 13497 TaxID=880073 RepID=H1XWA3_CALAY|nr:cytochrome c family protein [Caldithrix abyssi]APF19068.1 Cytochrome c554 and c-prime [Caldithrix abyssi DSM 13497]EHO43008.1 YVTN beta-propeller repeat-containing protein [Caldithrix abyssi DSM 13497]